MIHIEIYQPQTLLRKSTDFWIWSEKISRGIACGGAAIENLQKVTKEIHAVIDRINACEKEGDLLYIQSMRKLYQSDAEAVSNVILGKIYESLEDCCDAFKDVTKFVEEIALKYA